VKHELPLIYTDVKDTRSLAIEALNKVGLSDRIKHRSNELSSGQQQRVAIARALVNNPDIILGDEPTGNLDSKTSLEIVGIFQELNKSGKTVILITHQQNIAEHANRIIRIQDGKIVEDYKVQNPRNVAAELLKSDLIEK
jgi:putative ABC transport system ATP-binding protein